MYYSVTFYDQIRTYHLAEIIHTQKLLNSDSEKKGGGWTSGALGFPKAMVQQERGQMKR